MKEKMMKVLGASAIGVISVLIVWLPFLMKVQIPLWNIDLSEGSSVLWKNFDGNNYLVIAKTWYDKKMIASDFSNPLPVEYYPAHLPLFPLIISVLDMVMKGPWAMLLASLIGSAFCFAIFGEFLLDIGVKKYYWWLVLAFTLLPARWLAVRAIGSPEAWFVGFILASILSFRRKNYWLAGIFGALAQLTKTPALLLFGGYGLYFLYEFVKNKKWLWKMYPVVLIPLALVGYFFFVGYRTGDFWAYFHSGDNIHLFFPPFSIFAPLGQAWVGEFWLEDIIWIWIAYGVGILGLARLSMCMELAFSVLFFVATLFVAHRDLARYILPILPFALIGWKDLVEKKEFRIVMMVLIIPVLLYTWNFLLHNTAPVADWAPYL